MKTSIYKNYTAPIIIMRMLYIQNSIANGSISNEFNDAIPEINDWTQEYEVIDTKRGDL